MRTLGGALVLVMGMALGASFELGSAWSQPTVRVPAVVRVGEERAPTQPVTRLTVDEARSEVLLPAVLCHPRGTPGVDDWGGRSQAFLGCARAFGRTADFVDWFVFKVDAATEEVQEALVRLGARGRVRYSYRECDEHGGFDRTTRPEDYLQGDSMLVTIRWRENGEWRERAYEDFFAEQVRTPDGSTVVKPWTPHFVFHGSGAEHGARAGCLACPADCAGGLIANNEMPVYTSFPILRFDWSKAPPVGTPLEVRLRPAVTR